MVFIPMMKTKTEPEIAQNGIHTVNEDKNWVGNSSKWYSYL